MYLYHHTCICTTTARYNCTGGKTLIATVASVTSYSCTRDGPPELVQARGTWTGDWPGVVPCFQGAAKASWRCDGMARVWRWYQKILHQDPLRTKMLSSFVIWGGIDTLTQRAESKFAESIKEVDEEHSVQGVAAGDHAQNDRSWQWDAERTARQALFGLLVNATVTHYWWGFLERALPSRSNTYTLVKVALDQLVSAPLYYTVFHAYTGVALGESREQIVCRVEQRLVPTLQGVWCVWPFVLFLNFKWVSVHNRLGVALCTNLIFNVFVSYIGNKAMEAK